MTRLDIGRKAPAFTLKDSTGASHSLRDFLGDKVIVYFYPAAMTPGCTKQACDFRDNMATFTAHGYTVIGISPDPPEILTTFRKGEHLPFLLLSDPGHTVMTKYGAWGEKQLYGKTVTGVIRSTFVLDEAGRIDRALYAVKATGHVAKLMRDLDLT